MYMSRLSDWIEDIDFFEGVNVMLDGGFYHYLFPFLLVYAIVLTIMNKVEIFKDNKAVRVIIALVFGLFAVSFPITDNSCYAQGVPAVNSYGCTLGDFMIILFPGVTAFTIGILALYIVAAMLGVDLISLLGKDEKNQQIMKYILGALGLIVVVYYYAKGFGFIQDGFTRNNWFFDLLSDPLLYMLIIFGAIFFWISSEDKPKGDS
ncbi:MAG: hypothetical protein VX028_04640 [Nanoarchaeota archaeon]|nr:hypothetical protein [Nanoarchaeota archaeon]